MTKLQFLTKKFISHLYYRKSPRNHTFFYNTESVHFFQSSEKVVFLVLGKLWHQINYYTLSQFGSAFHNKEPVNWIIFILYSIGFIYEIEICLWSWQSIVSWILNKYCKEYLLYYILHLLNEIQIFFTWNWQRFNNTINNTGVESVPVLHEAVFTGIDLIKTYIIIYIYFFYLVFLS